MEEKRTINTTGGAIEVAQAATKKAGPKPRETTRFARGGDMKTIVLLPKTGREGEIRTFRINGKPYHIKTGQAVEVPKFLYDHIMDLNDRKKLSAKSVEMYAGEGKGLGDLK